MNALPHVTPERITELLVAAGSAVDTPTPRVTAARESASADGTIQESGSQKSHSSNSKRGNKKGKKGSSSKSKKKVTTTSTTTTKNSDKDDTQPHNWLFNVGSSSTAQEGKSSDGGVWHAGSEAVHSLFGATEKSSDDSSADSKLKTGRKPTVRVDSSGRLHSVAEKFTADAQAALESLRAASHYESSDDASRTLESESDHEYHSSDHLPRKTLSTYLSDSYTIVRDAEASVLESSKRLVDSLSGKSQQHISHDAEEQSDEGETYSYYPEQEVTESSATRRLMSLSSDSEDSLSASQHDRSSYLNLATQEFVLR